MSRIKTKQSSNRLLLHTNIYVLFGRNWDVTQNMCKLKKVNLIESKQFKFLKT